MLIYFFSLISSFLSIFTFSKNKSLNKISISFYLVLTSIYINLYELSGEDINRYMAWLIRIKDGLKICYFGFSECSTGFIIKVINFISFNEINNELLLYRSFLFIVVSLIPILTFIFLRESQKRYYILCILFAISTRIYILSFSNIIQQGLGIWLLIHIIFLIDSYKKDGEIFQKSKNELILNISKSIIILFFIVLFVLSHTSSILISYLLAISYLANKRYPQFINRLIRIIKEFKTPKKIYFYISLFFVISLIILPYIFFSGFISSVRPDNSSLFYLARNILVFSILITSFPGDSLTKNFNLIKVLITLSFLLLFFQFITLPFGLPSERIGLFQEPLNIFLVFKILSEKNFKLTKIKFDQLIIKLPYLILNLYLFELYTFPFTSSFRNIIK